MAPPHPSHLSLASTHRPSIAIFLAIIISVFIVPFLSLSSSELTPSAFPNLAYTLWDSLFGIVTSSPFYFFLLNFLIVALVFSAGVFGPSSKHSDELRDGENPQNDYYSAARIIHERLALDEFYGSQAPSPSYLRLIERSNVYVADEVQNSDIGETSMSKQSITKPIRDDVIFSASKMHSTNTSKMDAAVEQAVIKSSLMKNRTALFPAVTHISIDGHSANLDDEMISDADRNINGKDVQVSDEDHHGDKEAREETEEGITGEDCGNDDVQNADHIDAKHNVYDDHDDEVQIGDAFQESDTITQRLPQAHTLLLLQTQMHEQLMIKAEEEGNVGDKERIDMRAKASKDPEERAQESGAGGEAKIEEVQMMSMSREELNERASAFITAFRRKLISTAIVED